MNEDPLKQLIEVIRDLPNDLSADLESGSHHRNNRAAAEFAAAHPELMKSLAKLYKLADEIEAS